MSLNVTGSGRLTKDPELKKSKAGTSFVNFSLASDRRQKKEGQASSDFFECVAFGKTAELISKSLVKGSRIYIKEAEIQNDTWEASDGTKRTKTKLVIGSFEFGESKSETEARRAKAGLVSDEPPKAKKSGPTAAPADKMLVPEDDEDDDDFELPYT